MKSFKKKDKKVGLFIKWFSTIDQSVVLESGSRIVKQLHKYQFAHLF